MAMTDATSRRASSTETMVLNGWKKEARQYYEKRPSFSDEWWSPTSRSVRIVSRILGLLPWNTKFVWLSRMYQVAFSLVLILSTLAGFTSSSCHDVTSDCSDFIIAIDNILASGCLLGFLAANLKNEAFVECQFLVESYLSRSDFLKELNLRACVENGAMLLVWSVCLGSRLYSHSSSLALRDFAFAFNVFVLLGMCAYLLRLCRGLHYIVDSFCQYITDPNFNFEDAMQEWFLLHCTIRTACASVQLCLFVLQLTAMILALSCATSFYFMQMKFENFAMVELVPEGLCTVVLLHLAMRAAFVSDLCRRVPMLVNSSSPRFDLNRMYLVEYIVHCETGFYIFEVRLTSAMLSKSFYVACAATVSMLTQYGVNLGSMP